MLPILFDGFSEEKNHNYPKTSEIIQKLQTLLSENSSKTKLLHFTADACQDYAEPSQRSNSPQSSGWTLTPKGNKKVYTILRQSTVVGGTADNRGGYSDDLFDVLKDHRKTIYELTIREYFFVNRPGATSYNERFFDPDGEIKSTKRLRDIQIIENFSLDKLFDQYIKSSNIN